MSREFETLLAGSDPTPGFRIGTIYAFTSVGPDDEEGVCAFMSAEGGWMPMVAADQRRLESLRPTAVTIARVTGQPVYLKEFALVGEGEIVE